MGDEIKLTNGIISSRSGYQGDVTSYQISVPLQPGNSGGPLFDYNGNIVGIVNAKLTIGENVSYAIKSSYLLNLVEILQDKILLPTNNTLIGKTLSTQVKSLNKFVYIIEIN
jgi:S1-C subfamily serine protease